MKRGGKNRIALLLVTCALALGSSPLYAQTAPQPEVQVDTSVLRELSPSGPSGSSRPVLSRPVIRPVHPVLTGGQQPQDPTKPFAVRRTDNIAPITQRRPESFPVKQKVRTESSDPGRAPSRSAGTSVPPAMLAPQAEATAAAVPSVRPSAQPSTQASTQASTMPTIPAPPVAAAPRPVQPTAQQMKTYAEKPASPPPSTKPVRKAEGAPPRPGRKPRAEDVLASDALPLPKGRVAAAVAANPSALPPSPIPAPEPPGRRSKALDAGVLRNAPKVMPAVPARPVQGEQLAAFPGVAVADSDDPLLMQLKDIDKDSFVRSVENLANRKAPVPARKPQRGGMPPALSKDNQAAMPRGNAPGDKAESTEAKPAALAQIAPAAGGDKIASAPIDKAAATAAAKPGSLLSMPFMPGDQAVSAAIAARLDTEVIPMLRDRPDLRIQIQAFSSPDNDIRSSARRTALARALSVREYLISKGVEAPRMDIRALGMETDRDPLDRIDLLFFDPAEKS